MAGAFYDKIAILNSLPQLSYRTTCLNVFQTFKGNQWLTPVLHMNFLESWGPWNHFPCGFQIPWAILGWSTCPKGTCQCENRRLESGKPPKADTIDETWLWLWNSLVISVICASKCVDKVLQQNKATREKQWWKTSMLDVGITKKSISNDELEFLHLKKKITNFEVGHISLWS